MHRTTYGECYLELLAVFLVLIQNSFYLESQQFSAKVGVCFFIRPSLSTTGEVRPPSACSLCRGWSGAGLLVGFQSTQWFMMRGLIVADVRMFVQADADVGDLGFLELAGLFKMHKTNAPSWP